MRKTGRGGRGRRVRGVGERSVVRDKNFSIAKDRMVCYKRLFFLAEMEGVFQHFGNKRTKRFPVYKTVKGFDIYLRFVAQKCKGQLVEITNRDANQYLRITLLDIGLIRLSYKTSVGKGQLDLAMPYKAEFCDEKRHSLTLSVFRGVVSYGVDRASPKRFFVSRLGVPFSSPAGIVVGKGLEGCISGSTVVNRFNGTQEYAVGISSLCTVKSMYSTGFLLNLLSD